MPHQPIGYVTTNCSSLNRMMGGGLPKGQITLVYGTSNSGKTTLALQCAVSASRENQKVFYVDCENSFSLERLTQITVQDLHDVSSRIFVFKLQSFLEQSLLIEEIDQYISKNVALIVIDTITSLYRLELKNPELVFSSNRSINRQLAYLTQTAKAHDIAVLITSQVHNKIQEDAIPVIEPVATRVLKFWSQNILQFTANPKPSVRSVVVEKHFESSRVGASCLVLLDKAGIVELV